MTVSVHTPIEVRTMPLFCALGSCRHEEWECPEVFEQVCQSCAPVPVDGEQVWYEEQHIWPCDAVQREWRAGPVGFDVDQKVTT